MLVAGFAPKAPNPEEVAPKGVVEVLVAPNPPNRLVEGVFAVEVVPNPPNPPKPPIELVVVGAPKVLPKPVVVAPGAVPNVDPVLAGVPPKLYPGVAVLKVEVVLVAEGAPNPVAAGVPKVDVVPNAEGWVEGVPKTLVPKPVLVAAGVLEPNPKLVEPKPGRSENFFFNFTFLFFR